MNSMGNQIPFGRTHLVSLLLLFGFIGTATNTGAQMFEKVLLSDELFSGEKISFVADPPELNDQGKVAFVAFMSPSSDYFLFTGAPGNLEVLARQDSPAAGVPGEVYDSFNTDNDKLTINPSGVVMFEGEVDAVSTNDSCLWIGTPGNVQLIGRENGPAPDLVEEFFGSSPFFSSDSRLNRSGQISLRSTRRGTSPKNGVWTGAPDDLKAAAMTGNPAPDVEVNYRDISGNKLSQNGQIAFASSLNSSADKALFAGPPDALKKVFRFGEPCHGIANAVYGGGASDGITSEFFNDDLLTYSLRISGTGINTGNDSAVWAGTPSSPQLIVQEGDVLPGELGGGVIGTSDININSKGNLLFHSRLQNTSEDGLWWTETVSGTTHWIEVAREGALLAGLDVTLNSLQTTLAYSLSDNGDVIFYGTLAGDGISTTNDFVLLRWIPSSRTVQRIVQEGDTIEVAPGDLRTVSDFEFSGGPGHSASLSCGVNSRGQVAFMVSFANNTKGVMIANRPSTFPDWVYQNELAPGQDGFADDPNGDGVPNAMAYYLGFDAMENIDLSDRLHWNFDGADVQLQIERDATVTDLTARIEFSDALDGEWNPGPALNVAESHGLTDTLSATIAAAGEQGFVRLALTAPF